MSEWLLEDVAKPGTSVLAKRVITLTELHTLVTAACESVSEAAGDDELVTVEEFLSALNANSYIIGV